MNFATTENVLAAIERQAQSRTEALAERVRVEVVIPVCRKHKLTFSSGNGTYSFHKENDPDFWGSSRSEWCPKYLHRAFSFLDLDTHDRFNLGHYVRDVKESDL